MGLSQEELKRINDLQNTAQFQHSWKAIRNIVNWREKVKKYFILNILLLILSFILFGGLMLLVDEGVLPRSDFMDALMMFFSRLLLFSLALYFFTILLDSFLLERWDRKKKRKLRSLYEREILAPILQVLYPTAEVDTEHHISLNTIKEVVPSAKCYIQSGILELHDERDLEIVDLYAYTVSKGLATGKDEIKHLHEITGFIGQVYSIKNTHSLKGNLRIVPTKHFLNIKTQGGYLGNISGGKKINVDDLWHNEHYNIYCTDEQSARMFLTPAVIDLFNNSTSDCGLSLYSNESRIYIAAYNNKRLFAAPKNKDSLRSWSIEKAARNIKYALSFADKIAQIM